MSSNSYISISRKTFKVTVKDADTGKKLHEVGKGKDINEAIDLASKEIEEGNVEYGVFFN